MKINSTLKIFILSLLTLPLNAQNLTQEFETRKTQHRTNALQNLSINTIPIEVFEGSTFDTDRLLLGTLASKSTVDFDITRLVRILFLSNGEYDSIINYTLEDIPFWITPNDTLRGYWSENHMLMWMSANWLLHEKYGNEIDSTLETRLKHYLNLKITYGYYEAFSTTYAPYTLCGLLNLVDFCEDTEIRDLAEQAAKKLLGESLISTTDLGVSYPATSRGFFGRINKPYEHSHSNTLYLLTGKGALPIGSSMIGGFISTSNINLTEILESITYDIDTTFTNGHPIEEFPIIHSQMNDVDRMMFQWSSGSYFHPQVIEESVEFITDYNIWNHVDFSLLAPLKNLPLEFYPILAEGELNALSRSSVIAKLDVSLFKNKSIMLHSFNDFWKGKLGYQQFPIVATVDTVAVTTVAGKISPNWLGRNSSNASEHLPNVVQKSNLALAMYWPDFISPLAGFKNPEVALFWKDSQFDEVRENDLWLLGKLNQSYIAIRRPCTETIDGVQACLLPKNQTWVYFLGNEDMYNDFDNFESIVNAATLEEQFYYDAATDQQVFYAGINIDGENLEYTWRKDNSITSVYEIQKNNEPLKIYPTPTNDFVTIEMLDNFDTEATIKIVDVSGKIVHIENFKNKNTNSNITINVSKWPTGLYFVNYSNSTANKFGKIMIH